MPQLSAEAGVTAQIGVAVRSVAVILKDAVPGSAKEIPDTVSIMTGQDFKSRHALKCLDRSSCQIDADDTVTPVLFPMNLSDVLYQGSLCFVLERGCHEQPCILAVGGVFGPCDQLILSFHHDMND